MNTELLHQLKFFGFPQGKKPRAPLYYKSKTLSSSGATEKAYIPTLSELLKACGDKIYGIHKGVHGGWYAETTKECKDLPIIIDREFGDFVLREVRGDTPEEAVAKLWLELNKK